MLHRCRSLLTSLLLLLVTGLVPLLVSAQVPHDMAYQGVLTDAVGAPLTGPVTLVFRVFDMPSGGVPLYTETHSEVSIDPMDGSFLVQLGQGTINIDTNGDGFPEFNTLAFDASLFENGPNRYLEVQVGSGASREILDPRQMIGSVPYALVAEDVVADPATSRVGLLIAEALAGVTNAQSAAEAAQATADAVVDTQLSEAEVDAFVANNGFVTEDTDTQLSEAEVDVFVANNGFAAQAAVSSNADELSAQAGQIAALQAQVAGLLAASRFTACADGKTIEDKFAGLLWERKTTTGVHNVNSRYSWSSSGIAADGTAFTVFLADLNAGSGFAGHTDWRLPSISELQSLLVGPGVTLSLANVDPPDPAMGTNLSGQSAVCSSAPCIDPLFAFVGAPTGESLYWSASGDDLFPYGSAYFADFTTGTVGTEAKTSLIPRVRAVRTGSCGS